MPAPCRACGFANEPTEKFCGGCGIAINSADSVGDGVGVAAAGDPGTAPASKLSGAHGERRPVTILFSDLSGYTNLSESRDPEDIHRILNRHFEIVDQIVLDHGGTIDKHIGDAVMALFGAPVAHGNDPERAVHTALAIHAAMGAMSEELGETLTVHIGIASGQVVASGMGSDADREYTVTGHSVNLAARLVDQAKAGQTLVSDEVYRAVETIADAEDMGEIRVKGLDTAVPVWLLGNLTQGNSGGSGPIVGRQAELRQFQGALDSARQDGAGQAILLRAEAGIGKSRLVEEFLRLAEASEFSRHKGQCLDFGVGEGQDPVAGIVRSMLGIPPGTGREAEAVRAAAAVDEGLISAAQLAFLYDLMRLPHVAAMRAMYDAMDNETRERGKRDTLSALMEHLAGQSPILLVVEDLHWADSVTLVHVAHMAAAAHAIPVLMVLTSRIENDPIDVEWRRAARPTAIATVDLQPLGAKDARALAAAFADMDSKFVQDCIDRAEGNPMFLEQLLRSASQDSDDLPSSVQNLILARVDQLPTQDKEALQAASILGQHFLLPVLRTLIGDPSYMCSGPQERNLVRKAAEAFLFAHALIWESVYSSLLRDRRRDLHRQAAQVQGADDPILRAQHLDRADDPGAASAYLQAARSQIDIFRFEPAMDLLSRARKISEPGHPQFEILCMSGDTLLELARAQECIDEFRAALAVAETAADQCRAWLGMVAGMRLIDAYDDAQGVLDQAQSAAQADGGLGRELSQIHYFRGSIFFPLGNIEGCLEEHGKALEYAVAAGSPQDEAKALSGLGDAHYARGRMKTSLEHFLRCRDLCRTHGLGRIEVGPLYMIAWTSLYVGEVDKSYEDALHAIDTSVRLGHRRAEIVSRLGTARILYEMDDLEGASEQAELALAIVDELGASRFRAQALVHLARLSAQREEPKSQARSILDDAWEAAQSFSIKFVGPWVLGVIAQTSEEPKKIAWALKEGEALLDQGCVGHNYFAFYFDAMEVSLRAENWAECERYADALEAYTAPEPLRQSDLYIARGRALAALGRDPADADALVQAATLRLEAEQCGFRRAIPALEAALAATG